MAHPSICIPTVRTAQRSTYNVSDYMYMQTDASPGRRTRRERRANAPDSRHRRIGLRACRERRTAAHNPHAAPQSHATANFRIFRRSHTMPSHHKSSFPVLASRVTASLRTVTVRYSDTIRTTVIINQFNRTKPPPLPTAQTLARSRAL